MLQYVDYDLGIQQSLAGNDGQEVLQLKMQALLTFLSHHRGEGIFVLPRKDPLNWVKRHYRIYH